jgi:hypothetical protein
MSNIKTRQVTVATDPGSTSAKGSALSHVEMDSNLILLNDEKLENLSEDTTPQLGGTLDTNDQTITNSGAINHIDVTKRIELTENVANNLLQLDNQNDSGLGLSIKAGNADQGTYGSLAILSVADKDSNLRFIVKASGEVNVYDNLGVDSLYIDNADATTAQISTLTSGHDLNITTNGGTLSLNSLNWPAADGTANQVLQTNGSGVLSFGDKAELVDDTTPQLGGALDPAGQIIGPDSTRAYQIQGNQTTPSAANYDSFNDTSRVYGHVRINETTQPSNRYHSNPTLSLVTQTADAGSQNGRLRHNYFEGVLEMDGYDNLQTGFGRGHNAVFLSSMSRNSNASNNASTLAQQTGITIAPQVASTSTGGLTVTDMRAINMEPNINDANGTVTTLYGMYYNVSKHVSATINNQYSFYGAEQPATIYNAGGMELPSFTVANLQASSPVEVTRRTGNMVFCTDETGGAIPCFWDGSDWRRMSDRAVIS